MGRRIIIIGKFLAAMTLAINDACGALLCEIEPPKMITPATCTSYTADSSKVYGCSGGNSLVTEFIVIPRLSDTNPVSGPGTIKILPLYENDDTVRWYCYCQIIKINNTSIAPYLSYVYHSKLNTSWLDSLVCGGGCLAKAQDTPAFRATLFTAAGY